MRAHVKTQIKKIAYTVLGAVLFVAAWWIAAAVTDKALIFPTPAEALRELTVELKSALFWRSFGGSLLRALLGFAGACVLALVCAYAGKVCPPIKSILAPVVGILRSVPTMSVILLLVLWTSGDITALVVAGLVIFPVLYSGMDAALCSVPRELEDVARLYGGSKTLRFAKVYLPLGAPVFLRVAGGAASLTLKLTVAAEVLAQTRNSLGLLMQQTRLFFQIGRLMALTVVVVVAALLIEGCVYLLRRFADYE